VDTFSSFLAPLTPVFWTSSPIKKDIMGVPDLDSLQIQLYTPRLGRRGQSLNTVNNCLRANSFFFHLIGVGLADGNTPQQLTYVYFYLASRRLVSD
jgi:hypothetical protein